MSVKILIADHSETVRSIAENLFRKKGFEVVSAADGSEALELVRTAGVDLAILGSELGEIDGYTVSEQIKADPASAGIKTVLLLSTSEIVNQQKLLSSKADSTLNKPFSPNDLIETTSEVLGISIESDEPDPADHNDAQRIGDEVQELSMDDSTAEEIDFGSIFSNDESAGDDASSDDGVFLSGAEESTLDSEVQRDSTMENESQSEVREGSMSTSRNDPVDESIRLAEDQYGMETSEMEPEVERPHDYNWFIREMKKDLSQTPSKTPAVDSKKETGSPEIGDSISDIAVDGSTKTGSFDIEEIGSSKIDLSEANFEVEPKQESKPGTSIQATESDLDPAKLALAEKLLIKELAVRLAERMLDRVTAADMRMMLTEVLSKMKEM